MRLETPELENSTLLDYTTEHLNRNAKKWDERRALYGEKKPYCKKHFFVNDAEKKVSACRCNSIKCVECRPMQKKRLLTKVVRAGIHHKLTRHMVITCQGHDFREKYGPDESFEIAQSSWNHFRVLYEREFGHKLNYISLPRSQKDGYCHLHVMVGSYIPKEWLDKACENVGFGYSFIRYTDTHRLGGYLSKYWYKEHEWYIPENKNQYTTSRKIVLSDFEDPPREGWGFLEGCFYGGLINFIEEHFIHSDRPPPDPEKVQFGLYDCLPHFQAIWSNYKNEWKQDTWGVRDERQGM